MLHLRYVEYMNDRFYFHTGQAGEGNGCFLTYFRNEDVNLTEMQNSTSEFMIAANPHY